MRRATCAVFLVSAVATGCRGLLELDDKEYTLDEATSGGLASGSGAGDAQSSSSAQGGGGSGACSGALADACADAVPTGWKRVGYAGNRETPCGEGFTASDVLSDPTALADACTCTDCALTDQPNCATGMLKTYFDEGSGLCAETGPVLPNQIPGVCNVTAPTTLYSHHKVTPPTPAGGACSISGVIHGSAVHSTEARVCAPVDATCEAELCAAGGVFSECIATEGDKECPEGPFTDRHILGTGSSVACSPCGCSVKATCAGQLTVYTDDACTTGAITLPVNDRCEASISGTVIQSYLFEGVVESAACMVASPPMPTVTAKDAQTLCCK